MQTIETKPFPVTDEAGRPSYKTDSLSQKPLVMMTDEHWEMARRFDTLVNRLRSQDPNWKRSDNPSDEIRELRLNAFCEGPDKPFYVFAGWYCAKHGGGTSDMAGPLMEYGNVYQVSLDDNFDAIGRFLWQEMTSGVGTARFNLKYDNLIKPRELVMDREKVTDLC